MDGVGNSVPVGLITPARGSKRLQRVKRELGIDKHPCGLDVTAPPGCRSLGGTDQASWLAKEGTEAGAVSDMLRTKGPGSPGIPGLELSPSKPPLDLVQGGMPHVGLICWWAGRNHTGNPCCPCISPPAALAIGALHPAVNRFNQGPPCGAARHMVPCSTHPRTSSQ